MSHEAARHLLRQADAEIAQGTERLLEVAVVAKRLQRCPETIRRYIRRGVLQATRAPLTRSRGTNYLVSESALLAFQTTTSCNIMRQSAR